MTGMGNDVTGYHPLFVFVSIPSGILSGCGFSSSSIKKIGKLSKPAPNMTSCPALEGGVPATLV